MKLSASHLSFLAAPLAVALVGEVILARTFARAGIYFLNEESPIWMVNFYQGAVFAGQILMNFAIVLLLLLLGLLSVFLWRRAGALDRVLAGGLAILLTMTLALLALGPGFALSLNYLLLSAVIVALAIVKGAADSGSKMFTAGLILMGGSFFCIYAFKGLTIAAQGGVDTGDSAIGIFGFGELLAALSIVLIFMASGRTLKKSHLAGAAVLVVLFAALFLGRPETLYLIGIWAFGLTLNLPIWVYLIGIGLAALTVMRLMADGDPLRAYGLVFLLLGHRMLPLTYFDLLAVAGFILLAAPGLANQAEAVIRRQIARRPRIGEEFRGQPSL